MMAHVERIGDRVEHVHLGRPIFVAGERLAERTAGPQQGGQPFGVHRFRLGARGQRFEHAHRLEERAIGGQLLQRQLVARGATHPQRQQCVRKHGRQGPRATGRQPVDLHQHGPGQAAGLIAQQLEQPAGGLRIIQGAVLVGRGDPEARSERAQAIAGQRGQQDGRQLPRVQPDVFVQQPLGAHEAQVEADVVTHHRVLTHEAHQRADDAVERRCGAHIPVGDARDQGDLKRDRPAGVDQRAELLDRRAVAILHRADFDDRIFVRAQAGGLQIEGNVGVGQGELRF